VVVISDFEFNIQSMRMQPDASISRRNLAAFFVYVSGVRKIVEYVRVAGAWW
jgi:hypothetical protein